MDKKRVSKILARADRDEVNMLCAHIKEAHAPVIVKAPSKTLAMIKLRDPVRAGAFYLGEVIVCEAAVEIGGAAGVAVFMGDDEDKVLDMAILDAAMNKGVFTDIKALLALECAQEEKIKKEHAMHLKTMVRFESMDGEAPHDLNAFEKT